LTSLLDLSLELSLFQVPFLTLYKQYCANHNQATILFNHKMDTSAKFYWFIMRLKDQGLPELPSLLITPVQRIPRYRLLFEELTKVTPPSHPDFPLCKEALHQIQGVRSLLSFSLDLPPSS